MKCPHCNYTHGSEWVEEDGESNLKNIKGKEGDFYSMTNSIKMEKHKGWNPDRCSIYGCPKCKILFMGD